MIYGDFDFSYYLEHYSDKIVKDEKAKTQKLLKEMVDRYKKIIKISEECLVENGVK
jgi:hypothetical protein